MSRSYRRSGLIKSLTTGKYYKRYANSIVRNSKEPLPNGKFYKKMFDTWPICDYFHTEDLDEVIMGYIKDGYPMEYGYAYWAAKYHSR